MPGHQTWGSCCDWNMMFVMMLTCPENCKSSILESAVCLLCSLGVSSNAPRVFDFLSCFFYCLLIGAVFNGYELLMHFSYKSDSDSNFDVTGHLLWRVSHWCWHARAVKAKYFRCNGLHKPIVSTMPSHPLISLFSFSFSHKNLLVDFLRAECELSSKMNMMEMGQ